MKKTDSILERVREIGGRSLEKEMQAYASFVSAKLDIAGGKLVSAIDKKLPQCIRNYMKALLEMSRPVRESEEELQKRIEAPPPQVLKNYVDNLRRRSGISRRP